MRKFRLGDIVEVMDNGGCDTARIGDIGKVIKLWETHGEYGIEIRCINKCKEYGMYEWRFDLKGHQQPKRFGIVNFLETKYA